LYAKYGNRWYQIGDAAVSSGGNFSAQGVASQGAGTLATSIDRSNQSLQMGGNIVMSEQTISHNGSNNGIRFDSSGDLYIEPVGHTTIFKSDASASPKVIIENNNSNAQGGQLRFLKDKGAAGADGDDIGTIIFIADDAGQTLTSFASIVAEISEADNTDEAGKLSFYVAESDGTTTALTAGLVLEGEHATDGQVDVNIGAGSASMTTIAGDLDIDGDTITSAGALEIDAGGDVTITGQDAAIDATKKLYLDGGGDTYITESSADVLDVHVGSATAAMKIEENATYGRAVSFETSGVGFTQQSITAVGTDVTTAIGFRESNKIFLTFGSGNMTNLRIFFTKASSNCTLVLRQDASGSRTVTNWQVFESDGTAAAGDANVKWPGGTAPTLSTGANAIDIISFYWDATNQVAYGVASLNFS
jgi:hypothetical protein